MAQGLRQVGKGKDPVNYGFHLVEINGSVHGLEHLAAADENALNAYALHDNGDWVEFAKTL